LNKPYDEDLDQASKPAEWAVLSWLLDVGFTVTDHPQGDKGPDIHVARLGHVIEEFIVEVELMGEGRTDINGDCIYPTLSVLARRKMSTTLPTLIFHVTNDLRHALIVFDRDFKATPTQQGRMSANHTSGEPKKYVNVERVLKLKIGTALDSPFADLNTDRIRNAIEHETDVEVLRRYLGPVKPYGMNGVEWRRLISQISSGQWKPQCEQMPF
jgi:hypothetical protein